MKTMWDASQPPASPPGGPWDAAAGYIGGDTPHVWTLKEWQHLGRLPKLPIWVNDHPPGGVAAGQARGVDDALAALGRLYHIGCPRGSVVALDLEQAVAPPYVTGFGDVMRWAGFHVWVYGARAFVFKNPPLGGYWVADWTGTPHFAAGDRVRATQWQSGPVVDSNVVRRWQVRRRLWK